MKHNILDVSPLAIEKLRSQRIYPIVLFLKFKSAKHIKYVQHILQNNLVLSQITLQFGGYSNHCCRKTSKSRFVLKTDLDLSGIKYFILWFVLNREQRDAKHLQQKVTTKDARAMHENSMKMEHEFRSEFTGKMKTNSETCVCKISM